MSVFDDSKENNARKWVEGLVREKWGLRKAADVEPPLLASHRENAPIIRGLRT